MFLVFPDYHLNFKTLLQNDLLTRNECVTQIMGTENMVSKGNQRSDNEEVIFENAYHFSRAVGVTTRLYMEIACGIPPKQEIPKNRSGSAMENAKEEFSYCEFPKINKFIVTSEHKKISLLVSVFDTFYPYKHVEELNAKRSKENLYRQMIILKQDRFYLVTSRINLNYDTKSGVSNTQVEVQVQEFHCGERMEEYQKFCDQFTFGQHRLDQGSDSNDEQERLRRENESLRLENESLKKNIVDLEKKKKAIIEEAKSILSEACTDMELKFAKDLDDYAADQ